MGLREQNFSDHHTVLILYVLLHAHLLDFIAVDTNNTAFKTGSESLS